jgi:hypothetical protein
MNPKNPTTLIFLLSALEGLQESKNHLKRAAHELLLAAKSLTSTVSTIAIDSKFGENYPGIGQTLKMGEEVLNEVIRRIEPTERNSSDQSAESQKISSESALPSKKVKPNKPRMNVVK